MKKKIISLAIVLSVILAGCSFGNPVDRLQTMKGWGFQRNSSTNDYSVFLGFEDKNNSPVSASVDVAIRIENEKGEKVYEAKTPITPDNFSDFTSEARGTEYLAEIRIPESDIKKGSSTSGKVYLSVYYGETLIFDEVNCDALYCLPVSDVTLKAENLPVKIDTKDYMGNKASTIQIDSVSHEYSADVTPTLNVIVSGTKIYGTSDSTYDIIQYKIHNEDGVVAGSGQLFLDSLSKGDKFKDDSINIYDIEPGKVYTISFSSRSY